MSYSGYPFFQNPQVPGYGAPYGGAPQGGGMDPAAMYALQMQQMQQSYGVPAQGSPWIPDSLKQVMSMSGPVNPYATLMQQQQYAAGNPSYASYQTGFYGQQGPYYGAASGGGNDSVTQLTQILNTQGPGAVLSAVQSQGPEFAQQLQMYLQANPALPLSQALFSGNAQSASAPAAPAAQTVAASSSDTGSSSTSDSGTTAVETSTVDTSAIVADLEKQRFGDARTAFRKLSSADQEAAVTALIQKMQTGMTPNPDNTSTFSSSAQAIYRFLYKESGYDKDALKKATAELFPAGTDGSAYALKAAAGELHFNDKNAAGASADPQYLLTSDPQGAAKAIKAQTPDQQSTSLRTIAQSFVDDLRAHNGTPSTDDHRKELAFLKKFFPDSYQAALSAASTSGNTSTAAGSGAPVLSTSTLTNIANGATPFPVTDTAWTSKLAGVGSVGSISVSTAGADGTVNLAKMDYSAVPNTAAAVDALMQLAKQGTPGDADVQSIIAQYTAPGDGSAPCNAQDILRAFGQRWMQSVGSGSNTAGGSDDAAYLALDQYFRNSSTYQTTYNGVRAAVAYTDGQTSDTGGSGKFAAYLKSEDTGNNADVMNAFVGGTITYQQDPVTLLQTDPAAAAAALQKAAPEVQTAKLQALAVSVVQDLAGSNNGLPTDDEHRKQLAFLKQMFPQNYAAALQAAAAAINNMASATPPPAPTTTSDPNAPASDGSTLSAAAAPSSPRVSVDPTALANVIKGANTISVSDKTWTEKLSKAAPLGSISTISSDVQTDLIRFDPSANPNIGKAVGDLVDLAKKSPAGLQASDVQGIVSKYTGAPTSGTACTQQQILQAFAQQWMQGVYNGTVKSGETSEAPYLQLDQFFKSNAQYTVDYTKVRADIQYTDTQTETGDAQGKTGQFAAYIKSNNADRSAADPMGAFVSGTISYGNSAVSTGSDDFNAIADFVDGNNGATQDFGRAKDSFGKLTDQKGFLKYLHQQLLNSLFAGSSANAPSTELKHWLRVFEAVKTFMPGQNFYTNADFNMQGLLKSKDAQGTQATNDTDAGTFRTTLASVLGFDDSNHKATDDAGNWLISGIDGKQWDDKTGQSFVYNTKVQGLLDAESTDFTKNLTSFYNSPAGGGAGTPPPIDDGQAIKFAVWDGKSSGKALAGKIFGALFTYGISLSNHGQKTQYASFTRDDAKKFLERYKLLNPSFTMPDDQTLKTWTDNAAKQDNSTNVEDNAANGDPNVIAFLYQAGIFSGFKGDKRFNISSSDMDQIVKTVQALNPDQNLTHDDIEKKWNDAEGTKDGIMTGDDMMKFLLSVGKQDK